ncbi:toprim domain protein [Peribacillus deserti]|uniref:Toprim domain protein n=1 Tax=Peribacillus deserti TaxID=673318 RepID=A0ABS2QMP8_9BACI|nr:toprim domain-containing protein [Peribacillus deserti]MBM7694447.1 toprim domain protein [Peribacillus deserti]
MEIEHVEKVIIVEGTSDKRKVISVLNEPIEIICTNGTISVSRLEEIMDEHFNKEVYILVDADEAGEKLRKQFKREFPEALHLYIDKSYREVENAPAYHIATVLLSANIDVNAEFLEQRMY